MSVFPLGTMTPYEAGVIILSGNLAMFSFKENNCIVWCNSCLKV